MSDNIETKDGCLKIQSLRRITIIDINRKSVNVQTNWFWLFKHCKTLSFRDVVGIAYGYKYQSGENASDCWAVGLRTIDDDEIKVCELYDHVPIPYLPEFLKNLFDFAFSRRQEMRQLPQRGETRARNLATYLSKLIGVEVVPYRHIGW